jgi:hypothetical protein
MREEMYAPTHEPPRIFIFSSLFPRRTPHSETQAGRGGGYDGAQYSVDSGMHY